jgi:hypothetical protein
MEFFSASEYSLWFCSRKIFNIVQFSCKTSSVLFLIYLRFEYATQKTNKHMSKPLMWAGNASKRGSLGSREGVVGTVTIINLTGKEYLDAGTNCSNLYPVKTVLLYTYSI